MSQEPDYQDVGGWLIRNREDELKKLKRYNSVKVSKVIERLSGQFDPSKANVFALVVAGYVLKFNHSTQISLKLCDKVMAIPFWRIANGKEKENQKEKKVS